MTDGTQDWETLGRVAHPGGILVADPLLTVGVVGAVSRATGLQLQLVARRPVDDRTDARRRGDVRGTVVVAPAPRVLLPPYDEGTDLRVGWLDGPTGRPRWVHPVAYEKSSGGPAGAVSGPTALLNYLLPPLFDRVELVLAWPEIGFAERVVALSLPDRAAVERASVSVWDAAPVPSSRPTWTHRSQVSVHAEQVRPEEGTAVVDPQVLWRSDRAVVVLTRLSRHERVWQAEVFGHARDTSADIASGAARAAHRAFAAGDATASYGGLTAGVVHGDTVHWDRYPRGQSTGGPDVYDTTRLCTLPAPVGTVTDTVRVAVRWPAVGLPDTELSLRIAATP